MQKIIISLFLLIGLLCPWEAKARVRQDHLLHFAVAFGLTQLGYQGFRKLGADRWASCLYPLVLVNAAGMFKEMAIDRRPDGGDALANGLGSFGAIIINVGFDL